MKDLKRGDNVRRKRTVNRAVGIVLRQGGSGQYEVYWSDGNKHWHWREQLTKIEDIEND